MVYSHDATAERVHRDADYTGTVCGRQSSVLLQDPREPSGRPPKSRCSLPGLGPHFVRAAPRLGPVRLLPQSRRLHVPLRWQLRHPSRCHWLRRHGARLVLFPGHTGVPEEVHEEAIVLCAAKRRHHRAAAGDGGGRERFKHV